MTLREKIQEDNDFLLVLWERSVTATHAFLTQDDIAFYKPMVAAMFELDLEFWVIGNEGQPPVGFMALDSNSSPVKLEALFIEPEYARQGLGSRLVRHALQKYMPLDLDVNEQNPGALSFYTRLGFRQTGHSPLDGAGKPFPLIHMRHGG